MNPKWVSPIDEFCPQGSVVKNFVVFTEIVYILGQSCSLVSLFRCSRKKLRNMPHHIASAFDIGFSEKLAW